MTLPVLFAGIETSMGFEEVSVPPVASTPSRVQPENKYPPSVVGAVTVTTVPAM
jgi:hypothetical protein